MRDPGVKKWCVVRESNPQPWAYKPLCQDLLVCCEATGQRGYSYSHSDSRYDLTVW